MTFASFRAPTRNLLGLINARAVEPHCAEPCERAMQQRGELRVVVERRIEAPHDNPVGAHERRHGR